MEEFLSAELVVTVAELCDSGLVNLVLLRGLSSRVLGGGVGMVEVLLDVDLLDGFFQVSEVHFKARDQLPRQLWLLLHRRLH